MQGVSSESRLLRRTRGLWVIRLARPGTVLLRPPMVRDTKPWYGQRAVPFTQAFPRGRSREWSGLREIWPVPCESPPAGRAWVFWYGGGVVGGDVGRPRTIVAGSERRRVGITFGWGWWFITRPRRIGDHGADGRGGCARAPDAVGLVETVDGGRGLTIRGHRRRKVADRRARRMNKGGAVSCCCERARWLRYERQLQPPCTLR